MSFSFTKKALITTVLLSSTASWAATQGVLGSSSSGDLVISVRTIDQISISGLKDIVLAQDATGNFIGQSGACVYRNATGTYSIRALGSGNNSSFELSDGGANTIAYDLNYDDGNGAMAMSPATTLRGRYNANTSAPDCEGDSNGTISVSVAQADISAVPAGNYSGTLTLTVSPE